MGSARHRGRDRLRQACRVRHYSIRTEDAYHDWARRFILFHDKRHPQEMAEPEVNEFLTDLAVNGHVAASTQNQALCALLFLYEHVLERPLDRIDGVVRANRPKRLPVEQIAGRSPGTRSGAEPGRLPDGALLVFVKQATSRHRPIPLRAGRVDPRIRLQAREQDSRKFHALRRLRPALEPRFQPIPDPA